MALEIRRTPVLYGEDAKRFLKEIENPDRFRTPQTKAELEESMEKTKRIWEKFYGAQKDKP